MEQRRLDFAETFKDAFVIGIKNAPSIVGAILLFVLTIWIPYINIGTFIAITLLPTKLSQGEVINPLDIFESKYRRYMGEFFITMGLMIFPLIIAFLFLYIPGIVLSLAWTLSYYFLIEKGKNPMQAIKASNDATYGSKWTMFFVMLVYVLALYLVLGIFYLIFNAIGSDFLTIVAMVILGIIVASIGMAINASIWKQLKDNVE